MEFLGEWGPRGDGPGKLSDPASIAVDTVGNVYIADAGSRFVHKFDPGGRPLLSFQDLYLKSPRGIAVDEGGGIYVTDEKANLLFIFRTDGSRYLLMRSAGGHRLQRPSSITVNSSGEIFLRDSAGILAFYPSLRQSATQRWKLDAGSEDDWGMSGDLHVDWSRSIYFVSGGRVEKRGPDDAAVWSHIFAAVDPAAGPRRSSITGSDRLIFVANAPLEQITIMTTDGISKVSEPFSSLPTGEKPTQVLDLAWSPRGELLLLDRANARVLRFRVNL